MRALGLEREVLAGAVAFARRGGTLTHSCLTAVQEMTAMGSECLRATASMYPSVPTRPTSPTDFFDRPLGDRFGGLFDLDSRLLKTLKLSRHMKTIKAHQEFQDLKTRQDVQDLKPRATLVHAYLFFAAFLHVYLSSSRDVSSP
jgi:hypothetical protein